MTPTLLDGMNDKRKVRYLGATNANDPGPLPIQDLRTRKVGF
jgi:hypothetical protein